MGGVIARMAVRQLELEGIDHQVSHLITSDSPHKGANVPVGAQAMLDIVDDNWLLSLFNIAEETITEFKAILDAPATRQLLLRYKGASPHQMHRDL